MINHDLVAAIAGRSGASQADVVAAFRDSTRQDLANVRAASANREHGALALHAHRLRGASEMMGARALAEACRLLEESAGSGDAERMAQAFVSLEDEAKALETYLQSSVAGFGAAQP